MPVWLPYAVTWLLSTLLGGAAVYAAIRSKLADHSRRISTLESEVGTRNTGLRGAVHDHTSALLKLDGRITTIEGK